jgi:hypothetical protein
MCDACNKTLGDGSVIAALALLVSVLTWLNAVQANSCGAKRAISNEIVELVIATTDLAQNQIGLPYRDYSADGKPFLVLPPQPSNWDPNADWVENVNAWNKNFRLMRAKRDLLIAKAAILGESDLRNGLRDFGDALSSILNHSRHEKSYDQLWDNLSISKCRLLDQIGSRVNSCFRLENNPLDCDSEHVISGGNLQPL